MSSKAMDVGFRKQNESWLMWKGGKWVYMTQVHFWFRHDPLVLSMWVWSQTVFSGKGWHEVT